MSWQLQDRRHLTLGEQIDLKVEVGTLVGLRRQSVLAASTKSERKIASSDTVIVRN